jgi:hypothetical protein
MVQLFPQQMMIRQHRFMLDSLDSCDE